MTVVVDGKLVFSRDQIVCATDASKNFGKTRKAAQEHPVFVNDRNGNIDTVIVSFDEFEQMAVRLNAYDEEQMYAIAYQRIADADSDPNHKNIPMSKKELESLKALDITTTSDEDFFE